MSDRPCNLYEFRLLQRRHAPKPVTTQTDEHGWERVYVDGRPTGTCYMRLPPEAECSAFGGECECG